MRLELFTNTQNPFWYVIWCVLLSEITRKNESAVGKLKFELVDSFTQPVGMAQSLPNL